MQSLVQGLVNILVFVVFVALLVKLIWMRGIKKLKFLVKREDTGKVAQMEIEEKNQVFNLLEMSRSKLNFDESAILCMHQEGEDDDVSEAIDLKDIANPKTIWIVKEKGIKKDMSKFVGSSKRSGIRQPTKQEKLLKKLKIQATSNDMEQGEVDDIDGKPMKSVSPTHIPSKWDNPELASKWDGNDTTESKWERVKERPETSDVSKEISVDVKDIDEEKRKRLREVEIKVAKYTDKLELSGKETSSSIKEKVAQYRQQLLEENEPRKSKKKKRHSSPAEESLKKRKSRSRSSSRSPSRRRRSSSSSSSASPSAMTKSLQSLKSYDSPASSPHSRHRSPSPPTESNKRRRDSSPRKKSSKKKRSRSKSPKSGKKTKRKERSRSRSPAHAASKNSKKSK